jgi:di- and tripeptidase
VQPCEGVIASQPGTGRPSHRAPLPETRRNQKIALEAGRSRNSLPMRHTSRLQHADRRRLEEATDRELRYKSKPDTIDSSHSASSKYPQDGTVSPASLPVDLKDFVWRFQGGRRSERAMGFQEAMASSNLTGVRRRAPSPMTFDPWASKPENDSGCDGCERIRLKEQGHAAEAMASLRLSSGESSCHFLHFGVVLDFLSGRLSPHFDDKATRPPTRTRFSGFTAGFRRGTPLFHRPSFSQEQHECGMATWTLHASLSSLAFSTSFPYESRACTKLTKFPPCSQDFPPTPTSMPSSTLPSSDRPAELDQCPSSAPDRVHELKHDSSVLALAVDDEHIFAGTQNGEIVVWSLGSFQLVNRVQAHKRSVLCLFLTSSQHQNTSDGGKTARNNGHDRQYSKEEKDYLISSAGDAIVSIWCPKSLKRLYEIYSTYDVGDIFSVAYSAQHETVYMGAQNTTIQWVDLKHPKRRVAHDSAHHPDKRQHRFFDSKPIGGASTPRRNEERWNLMPLSQAVLEIDKGHIRQFAHYGYVYCMLLAKGPTVLVEPGEEVLISGGGDGTIKLWRLQNNRKYQNDDSQNDGEGIEEIMTLGEDDAESVLSLAIDGSLLYGGKLNGIIELWDLDTKQRLRVLKAHDSDIMSLQIKWGLLWSAAADGAAARYSTVHYLEPAANGSKDGESTTQRYQCLSRWKAHDGKILASIAASYHGDRLYITGANDDKVSVWRETSELTSPVDNPQVTEDAMFGSLREFVSYKTVSSRPEYAEDCRMGATFLGTLFKRLGATVEMLSTDKVHNPVVFAKFSGKLQPPSKRKRILFYGHYDVVPADTRKGGWETDPFSLQGLNGYLYGRGVTDNKGPIIAALYAVTDLVQAKALESDVVFLIEGEEESGSRGFRETVQRNKELVGDIDYILLANSYWLDDDVPCLTYGLRGVLHATVCVDSQHPDLHSGVDGSYMMSEPLSDLTLILSKLKGPRNKITIPGFYDGILPLTSDESARYDEIASILMKRNPENGPAETLKRSLMARWREPNLTIHRYRVSGPDGSLVSSHASANISFRLVPGQEVDEVIELLQDFLRKEFADLESSNSLSIKIDNKAEPWLGDPDNYIFRTLEEAVMQAWGPEMDREVEDCEDTGNTTSTSSQNGHTPSAPIPSIGLSAQPTTGNEAAAHTSVVKLRRPLYIREGGSIPAIRFLEKEFGALAAHVPCGQASDAAHLENERMRVMNLLKSREIFGTVFRKL